MRALPTTPPEAPADDESAGPAPASPAAPPTMPPVEATRTMSGLVKRATRAGNGSTVGVEHPSGDLLDTLRRHTAGLHGDVPADAARPAAQPRGPEPSGWDPPPAAPASPPPPQPGASNLPRGAPTSPAEPQPNGWGPPRSGSGPESGPWPEPPPADRPWPPPPPLPEPPPADRPWPPPPPLPEPPPPTWWPTPAPPGWSPAPPTLPSRTSPPGGAAHAPGRGGRVTGPRPAGNGADDGTTGGGATNGGLTRRVRGAQIPTTEPVRMRRAPGPSRPAGRPGTPPPRTAEQRRAADDVYRFLSSFTAGVRRGLDETAPRRDPDDRPGPV